MKINLIKFVGLLYYLSLIILLILYLFPGSLIGYILFGDLEKQPNLVKSSIGTSINHFFYFIYLALLATFYNLKKNKFINSFYFLFLISILLEISHFIIPKRAFEINDLLANAAGVLIIFLFRKIAK